MVEQCKTILNDIINYGKLKDLLGQYSFEKNYELENHDKLNLLPIHMHINKDLVDFCYMTSSMLLEVYNLSIPNR